jgi:translation initiation factor 2B subunit (eIF-2B alpha/beta/delta family)
VHPIEHLRYVARSRGVDATSLVREAAVALASLRADHANLVIACRRIVERHPTVAPLWWMSARLLLADDPASTAWELADEIEDDRVTRGVAAAIPDGATVVTIGWPQVAGEALMRRPDVAVRCADADHEASAFLQRLERAEVTADPVRAESLARALADADLAMIDAGAVSSSRLLAPLGSHVLAAVARSLDVPVWLVAGTGRRLPPEYVDEIVARTAREADEWGADWDADHDVVPLDLATHVADADGVAPIGPTALRSDAPFAPELLRVSPI